MIYTTLNKIREHSPCKEGWTNLLAHLGKTSADDEPLALSVILESNGLDDALWCLRSVPEEDNRWRKLAVKFARSVQHLMTDQRSLTALDVAERYADGLATDAELAAAGAASRAAALAASGVASWVAAWAAAGVASGAAAGVVAWDVARDASRAAMSKLFLDCLEGEA